MVTKFGVNLVSSKSIIASLEINFKDSAEIILFQMIMKAAVIKTKGMIMGWAMQAIQNNIVYSISSSQIVQKVLMVNADKGKTYAIK